VKRPGVQYRAPGRLETLWFHGLAYAGYKRVIVREILLADDDPIAAARIPLEFSFLDERQLDEYNAFRRPLSRDRAQQSLARGEKCFVARHDGRIAGTCWAATGRAWSGYLSTWVSLAPDEAYAYDAFTAPEFRGQRVFPALTREIRDFYRSRGLRRIIGFTVPENAASMSSVAAYRPVGVIGRIGAGRMRHEFVAMDNGAAAPVLGETERNLWERSLDRLESSDHYLDAFLGNIKRNAYLSLVERWGGVPENGRVLKTDLFEEAVGPDAFLLDLSRSKMLLGMDVSSAAPSRARQRDTGRKARYIRADARAVPLATGSVDLIISPSTLDHFRDPRDLGESLRELRRVLSCDGRLIITLDNRQNVFDPLLRLASRVGMVPFFMGRSYTAKELSRELERAGFSVVETTAIVHNPRLTAVSAVGIARRLRWPAFTRAVRSALLSMQRLQGSRWEYYSGCFVGALAVPRKPAAR
jgi:SAM-dependent methyltransferase/ribosomal protein S18 acetylase RimI-like enzyme